MTAKEIADQLGINEKTIGRWREEEKWDSSRTTYTMTKANQLEMFIRQLNVINTNIEERDPKERYASTKEADTIIKLTAAIKSLENETSIADIVDVSIRFTNWIKDIDAEESKRITLLFDKFIKSLA